MSGGEQGDLRGRGRGRGRGWWKPPDVDDDNADKTCDTPVMTESLYKLLNPEPKPVVTIQEVHRQMKVSSIPHISDTLLEPEDVKYFQEQVFGELPLSKNGKKAWPKLPLKCVQKEDRYIVEKDNKQVDLLKNSTFKVNLLCVDEHDVFHIRSHVDPTSPKDIRQSAALCVENMQKRMYAFYTNPKNKLMYAYGRRNWIPVPGEIVVVRLRRAYCLGNDDAVFSTRANYHRARLVKMNNDGATIELLDDYGAGGVAKEAIYKIVPCWAEYSPQIFTCELGQMGLFKSRKLVHTILQKYPIPDLTTDPPEFVFDMTFTGEMSGENRPCVNLTWKSGGARKCFKEYVLQNLSVLAPYYHLSEDETDCQVLRCDKTGHLWVQFKEDNGLLKRMSYMLNKLRSKYETYMNCCQLSQENILNSENKEANLRSTYVALLPDDTNGEEILRRVKILKFRSTKDVTVAGMDYGKQYTINTEKLVPLSVLCPDLCNLPAMITRVHLSSIKSLETNNATVKKCLFSGEVKIALVHEWPKELRSIAPEVTVQSYENLDLDDVSFVSQREEEAQSEGYSHLFVRRNVAKAFNNAEMTDCYRKIEEKLNAEKQLEAPRAGATFNGKYFEFAWPATPQFEKDYLPV